MGPERVPLDLCIEELTVEVTIGENGGIYSPPGHRGHFSNDHERGGNSKWTDLFKKLHHHVWTN
jgi:hypothetical protein